MKIHYDKASDGLIIEFSDAKSKMSMWVFAYCPEKPPRGII